MSILEAIILGTIQGLTEFLPVSSSGHLEIAKVLFGNELLGERSLLFTIVVHFATSLSTIIVFRKDIWVILKRLFNKTGEGRIFSLKIIISMIPAVIVGLFLEESIAYFFSGQLVFVGLMLLITSGLLYLCDREKSLSDDISYLQVFWIGIAQAIAILPGISRSGATISIASLLGIKRASAAKFSFLMVIPLIFGSMLKSIMEVNMTLDDVNLAVLFWGFLAAFLSGLIACTWMIFLVKKSKLRYFSVYCLIVGIVVIFFWDR